MLSAGGISPLPPKGPKSSLPQLWKLLMATSALSAAHHFHSHTRTTAANPFRRKNRPPRATLSPEQESFREAFLSASQQGDLSSVLDLCSSHKSLLPQGQQVHARVVTSGLGRDDGGSGFLHTRLALMYGKCGALESAWKVFDAMPQRTVFSWNAMIGSCASNGRFLEALRLYREMRASRLAPDGCTLASVLKACTAVGDLHCGMEVHGVGIKCGAISSVFVVNALVTMYAKCGQYIQAKVLFDSLPHKTDVVSWNSIISACLHERRCGDALELFRQMARSGMYMNSYTVVGILQACTELVLLKLGKEIHASVLKFSLEYTNFEGNALIVMYARCGRMGDAIHVFLEMSEKDIVSWNSMLSGYVQNELYEDSVEFFIEMLDAGCQPDQVSVINIASALGRSGKLLSGMEIHAYAVKHGFDFDLRVGNTFMDMYMRCSFLGYAERIFCKMPHKDYVSWTTAIASYARKGHYLVALDLFREILRDEIKVDALMIGSILLACGGLPCIDYLKQIHCFTIRHGLLDLTLENSIIDTYGECSEIGYALNVFENIDKKDVVSWTSLIHCYVQNGLLNEALSMFVNMGKLDIEPDGVALSIILGAISNLSSLRKGKEIHAFVIRKGFTVDKSVSNSLVDMYASCGDFDACYTLFDSLENKDLFLWTSLISGCGMHGRGREAIHMFRSMLKTGVLPDHVTFLALLYACGHSGLADEGKMYLDVMKNVYKLEPWPEHYTCVVDILGRSGRLNEAYEFIEGMPTEPTAAAWCALLRACHIYSNDKIGGVAAHKLLELEPEKAGKYVLVSNVFAAAGRWDDAEDVREQMQDMGLRKEPACSWIEIGNEVHSFIARDTSHPMSEQIYSKLKEMTEGLQKDGEYASNTGFILHDVDEEEKKRLLYGHSERLAVAYGFISTQEGTSIRVTKNLRICGDCHEFIKLVSKAFRRKIIVRDINRFHHFKDGSCSCRGFW